MTTQIVTTLEAIKAAFTEWDERYRADPEAFMNEAYRLLYEEPETYGEACAPYFVELLKEVAK